MSTLLAFIYLVGALSWGYYVACAVTDTKPLWQGVLITAFNLALWPLSLLAVICYKAYVERQFRKWVTSLALATITVGVVGCASWHEQVSDFADQWGDKLGLDVEPSEQPEAPLPPVVIDEPTTPTEPPVVTPDPPQNGPQLPAKAYPGTITRNDAATWTLDNDPGGWDQIGAQTWNGKTWDGCSGADVVGRNAELRRVKIKWSEYTDPNKCLVFVLTDNSTGRPRNVYAKWIKDL